MSLAQAQRPREPALQQLAFLKELSQAASDRGRRSTMPWLSTAIILAAAVATAHEDNAHDHRDLGIVIKNVYGAMACGESCVLEPHRASVVVVTRGDADAKAQLSRDANSLALAAQLDAVAHSLTQPLPDAKRIWRARRVRGYRGAAGDRPMDRLRACRGAAAG